VGIRPGLARSRRAGEELRVISPRFWQCSFRPAPALNGNSTSAPENQADLHRNFLFDLENRNIVHLSRLFATL
jgi:hypothetical protein